jgi:heme exporter protein C
VKLLSGLGWLLLLVLPLIALYMVFMVVPNEREMGEVQRIFYFHVGSAMVAFTSFFVVMIASIGYLITAKRSWDRVALATTEVGVLFLTIVVITGPLWAKPVWGVYWVWQDARLITTLVLWIYFTIYLLLRNNWGDDPQGLRFAAVLGIVGFLDVPIIYFSVKWWNYIHPSHVMGPMGGGLHPTMARALGVSTVALFAVWLALILTRIKLEKSRDHAKALVRELSRNESLMGRGV